MTSGQFRSSAVTLRALSAKALRPLAARRDQPAVTSSAFSINCWQQGTDGLAEPLRDPLDCTAGRRKHW